MTAPGQLELPGTAPDRRNPWAPCDGCGVCLPVRAVVSWHPWDAVLRLDPPGYQPELDDGCSAERWCGGCAPGRWDAAAARAAESGWTLVVRGAVLVSFAELNARGAV